jgi:hypothetical protein
LSELARADHHGLSARWTSNACRLVASLTASVAAMRCQDGAFDHPSGDQRRAAETHIAKPNVEETTVRVKLASGVDTWASQHRGVRRWYHCCEVANPEAVTDSDQGVCKSLQMTIRRHLGVDHFSPTQNESSPLSTLFTHTLRVNCQAAQGVLNEYGSTTWNAARLWRRLPSR